MTARLILLVSLAACTAVAQELPGGRDFLTDYEIDVLRDRQEFKDRIAAYVKFASLRLELIEQSMVSEEPGRGANVHRSLTEYSSIIEAVDDVIDDALARNRKMDDALQDLYAAEQRFSARLTALAAEPAADAWRYEFALEDAIDITADSLELLAEDLGDRKRAVLAEDEAAAQRRKESMAPERRAEAERDERRQQAERDSQERKRPSLLRPGEKLGGQ